MKFIVKKECWHKSRRLMPGDTLEAESADVRWMKAQGKIDPSADADPGERPDASGENESQNNRRGRKAGGAKTAVPGSPAETGKGESHE